MTLISVQCSGSPLSQVAFRLSCVCNATIYIIHVWRFVLQANHICEYKIKIILLCAEYINFNVSHVSYDFIIILAPLDFKYTYLRCIRKMVKRIHKMCILHTDIYLYIKNALNCDLNISIYYLLQSVRNVQCHNVISVWLTWNFKTWISLIYIKYISILKITY